MNAGRSRWLTTTAAAIQAAEELLRRLGSLTRAGALTPTGAEMAGYPLHPRLARLAIEQRAEASAVTAVRWLRC